MSNGHHRFDALMKTNPDQRVGIRILREADDVTLQDAHDYGFLINALQGNIDAAESALVLRKMPDVMDLLGHLEEMKTASGLSKLPEDLIMRVYQRSEIVRKGGKIGDIAPTKSVASSIGKILDFDRIKKHLPAGTTVEDVESLMKDTFQEFSKKKNRDKFANLAAIEDDIRGRLNLLIVDDTGFFPGFGEGLKFDKFTSRKVADLFSRVKTQLTKDFNTHTNAWQNPSRIGQAKGSKIRSPGEHRLLAAKAGIIMEKTKNAWENSIGASNPFLKDAIRIVKEEQAGKMTPDEARDALIKIIDSKDSYGNPMPPKPDQPQASYVPKFNKRNAMPRMSFNPFQPQYA